MKYLFAVLTIVMFGCSTQEDNQGDVDFANGKYAAAVVSYSDILSMDPSNERYLYNRGRAYEELGKYKEAIADFEEVTKINPKNASAFMSLSKIAYNQEDYNKALFYAGAAIKHKEGSAKAHFLSARAAHQLGYAEQAMEAYNNAISIDKNYGEAYLYRGALKIGGKRSNSACEDFKRARSLDTSGADNAIREYCS